jgi:hypothetical protein
LDSLILDLYKNSIDVAFIAETWWSQTSLTIIKGYSVFYKNREGAKGGGVCIFVNNMTVKSFEVNDNIYKGLNGEHIWCSIQYGIEKILCGCVYRPPLYERVEGDNEILAAMTAASKTSYDGFIICGDFNHPSLSWTVDGLPYLNFLSPGNLVSKLYCDVLLSLGL